MSKSNYGVITEQGYPVGQGLGFNSVNENELNNPESKNNKDIDHYKKSEEEN